MLEVRVLGPGEERGIRNGRAADRGRVGSGSEQPRELSWASRSG